MSQESQENTNLHTVTHDLVPVSDNNQDADAGEQSNEGGTKSPAYIVSAFYIYLFIR